MSEGKLQNDVLTYVTHSSVSLKEKAFEIQTTRGDEEDSNPMLADDDALDDSSSSYCTALCSLSEYSEALEDEAQTVRTDPPCENTSSESAQSVGVPGQTSSTHQNTDIIQDLKTKQRDSNGTSQDVLSNDSPYGQNPVLIESKISLNPKITILNVSLININSVDADQDSTSTSASNPTPWNYFRSKKDAGTKPDQIGGSVEHKTTPVTFLTRSTKKFNQKHSEEHSDIKPDEHPTTLQQSSRNTYYKPSPEFKLDSGESISKMKWEGEEQSRGLEKDQAELSVNTGNRKPPASCTSMLTASKQKSGILPRCYSKRLLATRIQQRSPSPPVSQRLKTQNRQSVGLSTSLLPTPCSNLRQHCSFGEGNFSMAAKVAGTTTGVRGLAALEYARSSSPEPNYLDVFNSWSSTPMSSDRDIHDWTKDVLSFKMPMISTNKNTSACSEASFECIDVAFENHEEVDRNAKTVPKRQIQLKRRDNAESHAGERDNIPSTPSRPRDTFQRQHSTPAAFHQESHTSENKSETKSGQTEQKQKLQKSLSLDETSSKTKMASCIIKNILSKRMQHEQNLNGMDVPDQIFCPIKADGTVDHNDCPTSRAKDESSESDKVNLDTVLLLTCPTSSQSPTLKTDSQTMSSIQEHFGVSSKILPKLITKHSFNPLLGGLGRMQFQGSGTEIAAYSETEKEKLSPSKEANQVSGEKLSCDSAKVKAWNLSAGISGAIGKQATLKATPEECVSVEEAEKQHYVKDQPTEKQEKTGEMKENTQSPTVPAWLACNLDAKTVNNVLSQSARCNLEKDQERAKEEIKPPEQSVNMGIQSQGKFRAIAPVHVVRDMRSLVKNTYNLSFRGPVEPVQGLDDTVPSFTTAAPHSVTRKRENNVKGHKQDEKPHLPKATLPLALGTVMDLASLDTSSAECTSKSDSILESNDKIPHTGFPKVGPISTARRNSCGLSNSPEAQDNLGDISQTNVHSSNTYIKQTACGSMPIQPRKVTLTNASKNQQSADTRNTKCKKPRIFAVPPTQPAANASLYCPPVESSDQQGSLKLSTQACSAEIDNYQTPDLPAKSQSSAGPPSACILTVAPAPVFPSYFYKPNLLGYQTISPNPGPVSYVQGPVLLQTQPNNQPPTAIGPVPLIKSLSIEGTLQSQPCVADGYPVTQESSKQMKNGDTSQKMPSSDFHPCTAFSTTLAAEGIHGAASMLYPEMSGSQHVSNTRHRLLDPETGQCFYVDMPQLPQRKMLFDPETCQYVEVVVPQQTLSSTVMTTPCAIPFPSLHIPTMYTPHCLSYVQTHHQVLPRPEP